MPLFSRLWVEVVLFDFENRRRNYRAVVGIQRGQRTRDSLHICPRQRFDRFATVRHLKNQLTVMTTAAAIFSAVFPDPIGTVVSIPIFLLAVPVVLRLYKSYLPKEALGRKIYMYRVASVGCFLGVAGALLYPASLSLQGVPLYQAGFRLTIAIGLSLAFLLLGLIFAAMRFAVSRRMRHSAQTP